MSFKAIARQEARQQLALHLPLPVKPKPREWVQMVLPHVSLARDPIEMFKTRAGFHLYSRERIGWEARELVALKVDIHGPSKQRVTLRGKAYDCVIVVPPNGNHPGWVDVYPN